MNTLKVLIVEDTKEDELLLVNELYKAGYDPEYRTVQDLEAVKHNLVEREWDLVISDYGLPTTTGFHVLKLVRELKSDIPFILVSSYLSEEKAVQIMKAGANDFISKGNLVRLGTVISRELEEAKMRREKRLAMQQLKESEARNRVLLEAINVGVLLINPDDHVIIDVNPTACKLIGLSSDNIIGKVCHDFVCPAEKGKCPVIDLGLEVDNSQRIILDANGNEIPVLKTVKKVMIRDRELILDCFMDISDRVEMENALKQSEERYQELIRNQGEGICIADLADNFIFCNPAAEEIFGVGKGDLFGRNLKEFLSPENIDIIEKQTKIRSSGQKTSYELEIIRNDGERRYLLVTGTPKLKPGDVFEGSFGVFRDITERKRNEEEIRKQRDFAESLIETAQAIVLVLDRDGRIIRFNKYAEELTGYSLDEAMGISWFENFIPENERVRITGIFREALAGNLTEKTRSQIKCKSGEIRMIEWSDKALYDSEGAAMGLLAIGQDITDSIKTEEALIKSEERFRTITNTANDGIIMINEKGLISYVNPAISKMLGYAERELIGKDLHQIIAPERYYNDHKKGFGHFQKTGEGAAVGKTLELEAVRADKREIPIELSLSALNVDGAWHAVGVIRDISERNDLEFQMRQSQKMEAIGTLAAGIAHEINTPTQFIGDNLTFLQDSCNDINRLLCKYAELKTQVDTDGSQKSIINEIDALVNEIDADYLLDEVPKAINQSLEGVGRISRIVQAMREFAHPGVEERTYIDINKAIESTVTVSRNEWKYVADLRTDLADNLPNVPCMPGEINQVILNIIVNAAQALKEKTGEEDVQSKELIHIKTSQVGNNAEIRIRDTGPGVPAAVRGRLFDPFFTTKGVGKGTGQGLAIAHTVIVKKHHGKIWFETEEGKGTTFIIQLPLEMSDE